MSTTTIRSVFDQLDTDWSHIQRSRITRHTVQRWQTHADHAAVLGGYDTVAEIITALHGSVGFAESDPILFALFGLDDPLARRLILQAFVPLAANLTRGRARRHGEDDFQFEVVEVLTEMIATFPLDTHPTRIARHLTFMVRRGLGRRRRRKQHPMVPLDFDAIDPTPADTSADRVARIVSAGVAGGQIDRRSGELLLLVAAGHQPAELARQAGCHRSVMCRRLQRATAAAATVRSAA